MKLPFIGNRLGGTVFYDGGNVYTDLNHINFSWKPTSVTELNYFSHTVGFGLRYPTPVGPVRIDLGYQLNPALYQFYNPTTHACSKIFDCLISGFHSTLDRSSDAPRRSSSSA